jgi:hypothetical protein
MDSIAHTHKCPTCGNFHMGTAAPPPLADARLREAVEDLAERAERAQRILRERNGVPDSWLMLDTSKVRALLAAPAGDATPEAVALLDYYARDKHATRHACQGSFEDCTLASCEEGRAGHGLYRLLPLNGGRRFSEASRGDAGRAEAGTGKERHGQYTPSSLTVGRGPWRFSMPLIWNPETKPRPRHEFITQAGVNFCRFCGSFKPYEGTGGECPGGWPWIMSNSNLFHSAFTISEEETT